MYRAGLLIVETYEVPYQQPVKADHAVFKSSCCYKYGDGISYIVGFHTNMLYYDSIVSHVRKYADAHPVTPGSKQATEQDPARELKWSGPPGLH